MSDKDFQIQDLIPSKSSFKLMQFDDFEFQLEPCTGGKLIEMSKNFGNVEELLSNPSAANISKIALSLMDYDSAVKFKKQSVKTIDVMNGEEKETDVGGYELLAMTIQGVSEQYDIYEAILLSFGYSKKKASETVKNLKDGIQRLIDNKINEGVKKKKKVVKKKAKKKKKKVVRKK